MKLKFVCLAILSSLFLLAIANQPLHSLNFSTSFGEIALDNSSFVSSKIVKISWPFEIISDPDEYTVFSSEMTFQLNNPTSSNVTVLSGNSRIFYLKVLAELENKNIEVFTETTGWGIPNFFNIIPGITNITQETTMWFNQPNLSHLPYGNYSLSYDLLQWNNISWYAYNLYLEVTENKVTISQEDGSFTVVIFNNTIISTSNNSNTTTVSLSIVPIVFSQIFLYLIYAIRKRKNYLK